MVVIIIIEKNWKDTYQAAHSNISAHLKYGKIKRSKLE